MNKVKLETLLPFIEEAFERNQKFKIPITGTSMNPLLYQGRDFVFIEKPVFPLEIGDIPLYRRDDGAFVLHRIVGKDVKGYTLSGDNQFLLEQGITDDHVIGVVTSMCIDGSLIEVTDPDYIKHKEKYVKNVKRRYPIRRFRHWFYGVRHGKK
ncbi:MAG: S24/S26 family peptidase [Clostridia bacterium]|nr:S24/S26 family peptidase [Clostridia bacterium]